MAIPKTIGRWNKVGLNRVTRRIAPWLPGFGVVVHRGRVVRLVAPACTTTASGGASAPWSARSSACSAWPTS